MKCAYCDGKGNAPTITGGQIRCIACVDGIVEEPKFLTLNDTNQKIVDRYAELAAELQDTMLESFEERAEIQGEMKGIKYVIDLLSETKFF